MDFRDVMSPAQLALEDLQLTPEEQQRILDVVERDEALRREENLRIRRLKVELQQLRRQGALRAGLDDGRSCARCRVELGRILNRGAACLSCRLRVCKKCRQQPTGGRRWVCTVCHKQMEIQLATGQWMDAFVRRPSRRRESVVAPTTLLRRQIRRSLTISNPTGSSRGSIELRAPPGRPRLTPSPGGHLRPRPRPRSRPDHKPVRRATLAHADRECRRQQMTRREVRTWDDVTISSVTSSVTSSPIIRRRGDRGQQLQKAGDLGNELSDTTPAPGRSRGSSCSDPVLLGPAQPPYTSSPPPLYGSTPPEAADHIDWASEGDSLVITDGHCPQREEEGKGGVATETERPKAEPPLVVVHPADKHQHLTPGHHEEVEFYLQQRRASMPVETNAATESEDDPRRSSEPHMRIKWPQLVELARRRERGLPNPDLRRQIVERRSGSLSPYRRQGSGSGGPGSGSGEPGSGSGEPGSGSGEPGSGSGGPGSGSGEPGSPRSRSSSTGTSRSSFRGRSRHRGESDSETDSESFGGAIFKKLTVVASRQHHSCVDLGGDDSATPADERSGAPGRPGESPLAARSSSTLDRRSMSSLPTSEPDDDIDRLVALHQRSATLSTLGSRSDSMASVYSAGEARYGTVPVRGDLQLALQYNYQQSALEVTVKQCRDLAAVDTKRNRSDPYVKAYLLPDRSKSGKRKTKTKKHTLHPVFDETLKFPAVEAELESRTLWVTVWHSDMFGRNDFLGELVLPVCRTVFDDSSPHWYTLQERSEIQEESPGHRGDVIIAFKYTPPDGSLGRKGRKTKGRLHIMIKEAKKPGAGTRQRLGRPILQVLPPAGQEEQQAEDAGGEADHVPALERRAHLRERQSGRVAREGPGAYYLGPQHHL